jgi:hypothetical protein
MAYRPPHKRNSALSLEVKQEKDTVKHKEKDKEKLKDEFPALSPAPLPMTPEKPLPVTPEKPKMNFASLFKNVEKKKKKIKKLKWGTVLLTKKGMVDSMTAEEREEEEEWKAQQTKEERLIKMADRMVRQQDVRRIYDPLYESPDELMVSSSEDEPEEEEEVLTDESQEDEFEPEI